MGEHASACYKFMARPSDFFRADSLEVVWEMGGRGGGAGVEGIDLTGTWVVTCLCVLQQAWGRESQPQDEHLD